MNTDGAGVVTPCQCIKGNIHLERQARSQAPQTFSVSTFWYRTVTARWLVGGGESRVLMLQIPWYFPLKSVFASRHGNCLQGLSLCVRVQRKLLSGMACLCGFLQVLQPDTSAEK